MLRPRPLLLATLLIAALAGLPATGAVESAGADERPAHRPLTIGLMPAVDSIPLIVAEAEGFFSDEGLDVTLEVFRDQLYREAALQANAIDGTVSDLVNAIRSWANGADYRVISSTQGVFSVVTSAQSGIRSLAEWPADPATVRTGLLEDSIINYAARRMLAAAGADPTRIRIIPTLQIPVRMEMLVAGELDAAVLPEPVTRMATAAGATEIVSTDVLDWTPGGPARDRDRVARETGRARGAAPRVRPGGGRGEPGSGRVPRDGCRESGAPAADRRDDADSTLPARDGPDSRPGGRRRRLDARARPHHGASSAR